MTTTLSGIAEELERAVMVCPQCEGEGSYADGLDEVACSTECTRCGGNGWIADVATLIRTAEDRETLESIIAWGDDTFGPCSQGRAIERAGEEWREMIEEGADVPIEAADVIICLLRIPGILDAINRKMGINRKREWNVRPDGTGYHVKARQALGGTNA